MFQCQDRQTDQTDRKAGRHRWRDRETDGWPSDSQPDRQTGSQERKTERQTDGQTNGRTDKIIPPVVDERHTVSVTSESADIDCESFSSMFAPRHGLIWLLLLSPAHPESSEEVIALRCSLQALQTS